jgi:hypothetical protein
MMMCRHTNRCVSARACHVAVAIATALSANLVWADWPSDPGTPLVLGEIQGVGAVNHAVAVTPDGAAWAAWIDMQCFGSLRVQRAGPDGGVLAPGGLTFDTLTGCESQDALIGGCADGSVVACRHLLELADAPLHRISASGAPMWGDGIVVSQEEGTIGGILGLPSGDVLVTWHAGWNIHVARYAVDGTSVWGEPATLDTGTSSNKRIFGFVSDGADGAFVVWDRPGGAYVRTIHAARINTDGEFAWGPIVVVPSTPGSSRHTSPVALADGADGAVVVWTVGSDGPGTIVPTYVQRIAHDGSLLIELLGARISLAVTRQFDPAVAQDEATGDVFVAWRDDVGAAAMLRAQRMSLAGARLWGDTGVAITPLVSVPQNRFDACWNQDVAEFAVAVTATPADAGDASVNMHRVDGNGAVATDVWPISSAVPAGTIQCHRLGSAIAVTWLQDEPSFNDAVVAQRVNADGTLGPPALAGDLNGDAVIDEEDRALLCASLGSTTGESNFVASADFNRDGAIDEHDLALFNDILPPCAGDIVTSATFQPPADGVTDAADLAFLLGAWGNQSSCADFVTSRTFAPPPDGVVDGADLAYLLGAWGECP